MTQECQTSLQVSLRGAIPAFSMAEPGEALIDRDTDAPASTVLVVPCAGTIIRDTMKTLSVCENESMDIGEAIVFFLLL